MIRAYVVPRVGTGSVTDIYRPTYFTDARGARLLSGHLQATPLGLEPWYLVLAEVTAGDHTTLVAHADVYAAPADLDASIAAGELAALRTACEGAGCPGDWVRAGDSYRAVLQTLQRVASLAKGLHARGAGRILVGGLTLDSLVSDLPPGRRTALFALTDARGIDRTMITGTTPLRVALRQLATGLPLDGLRVGGVGI